MEPAGAAVTESQGRVGGAYAGTGLSCCRPGRSGRRRHHWTGAPKGFSRTWRPVTVLLVFPPPPLVQEAGRHELHAPLLTLLICETDR